MNALTPERMEVDAIAMLAIERAKGVPIPSGPEFDAVFKLGFCGGAAWALDMLKTENAKIDARYAK